MTKTKSRPEVKAGEMYTTEEAALILSIHPETVRKLVREGRLEAVHISRYVRISGRTLLRIQERGIPTPAAA